MQLEGPFPDLTLGSRTLSSHHYSKFLPLRAGENNLNPNPQSAEKAQGLPKAGRTRALLIPWFLSSPWVGFERLLLRSLRAALSVRSALPGTAAPHIPTYQALAHLEGANLSGRTGNKDNGIGDDSLSRIAHCARGGDIQCETPTKLYRINMTCSNLYKPSLQKR